MDAGTDLWQDQWSTFDLQATDRDEQVQERLSRTHLPWDLLAAGPLGPAHQAWVRRERFGEVSVVESCADPSSVRRGATQIRETDGEWFIVLLGLDGDTIVVQDGQTHVIGASDGIVIAGTRPVELHFRTRVRKRYLLLPMNHVAHIADVRQPIVLQPDAPSTRIFRTFCGQLNQSGPLTDPRDRATVAHVLTELFAAAVRPRVAAPPEAMHAGLHALCCASIERRLGDPSLRPPRLAAELGVSLRTLHHAFAHQGQTVAGVIRELRLQRAHADVTAPGTTSLTEIAYRWSFSSPSHFSRSFKQRFGVTPRDLRAARVNGGDAGGR